RGGLRLHQFRQRHDVSADPANPADVGRRQRRAVKMGEGAAATARAALMHSDDRKPLRNTIILIILLLIVWELCYLAVGDVALRSPWQTVRFLGTLMRTDAFWGHLSESMQAFAAALVIAGALGLLIGFTLGLHHLSGDAFEPMLVALYSIPKITLYPILLLALGIRLS